MRRPAPGHARTRDSAHAVRMSKAERDMQNIAADLARVRAQLAALDNLALTHIDEALRAHEKRERLTHAAHELEQRFSDFEAARAGALAAA